jgi:hypothetical protein
MRFCGGPTRNGHLAPSRRWSDGRPNRPSSMADLPSKSSTSFLRSARRWVRSPFRLFFECDLSQSAIIVRAPRKWVLARAWERMTRRWAADIAIVTNARDAMEMFEQDWPLQGQTILVLNKGARADTAVDMLSRLRDWRGHRLPSGVSLLVAPAVDGDAIMIAAKTGAELNAALSTLEGWCRRENVPFGYVASHNGSDGRGAAG